MASSIDLQWRMSIQLLLLMTTAIIILVCQYQPARGEKPTPPPPATATPVAQSADSPPSPQGTRVVIPNLPPNHYRFWLKNHPIAFKEIQGICSQAPYPKELKNLKYFQSLHSNLSLEDPRYLNDLDYGKTILDTICSQVDMVTKSCWGYENNCHLIYLMPECHGTAKGKSEQEQKIAWFSQADFGYILERRRELGRYCSPDKYSNDTWKSSFECTKYFKTCRGQNLYVKFDDIPKGISLSDHNKPDYQLKSGNIGGWNCDLQLKRIQEEGKQRGFLRSWFTELENYNIISKPPSNQMCDITIEKQAFIIKLDSAFNMYHYFCNFLNLYATMHLNNKFSDDNEIIIWDNQLPRGNFELMWKAFTRNPIRHIGEFDGKRVCFKKFIFTLLPRMTDGLYYNTELVSGCSKTGLFDAFNKHILHRLNETTDPSSKNKKTTINVTILKRSTPHRKILNELEFKKEMQAKSTGYTVQLVDYADLSFQEQLRISRETDVLIGIHGAGLTNLLFLPDWASVIELHDCGDTSYKNLARLRGVGYFAPPAKDKETYIERVQVDDKEELDKLKKSKLVDNEKFVNYRIDIVKYMKLLEKAANRVRSEREKYLEDSNETPIESVEGKKDLKSGSVASETVQGVKSPLSKTHEEL